ncbi:MAG: response regulator [Candidatus Omnitrophica bacterium]|nr:response regulator [Candidatus Omnitrophota bacterium]
MPKKILIVDDEVQVREVFSKLLFKEGFTVECAGTLEEAVKQVTENDFDIALVDIRLGGVSGFEIVKNILEKRPLLRVVMISGSGPTDDVIAKSEEAGCIGFIGKNLKINEIKDNLKFYLDSTKKA